MFLFIDKNNLLQILDYLDQTALNEISRVNKDIYQEVCKLWRQRINVLGVPKAFSESPLWDHLKTFQLSWIYSKLKTVTSAYIFNYLSELDLVLMTATHVKTVETYCLDQKISYDDLFLNTLFIWGELNIQREIISATNIQSLNTHRRIQIMGNRDPNVFEYYCNLIREKPNIYWLNAACVSGNLRLVQYLIETHGVLPQAPMTYHIVIQSGSVPVFNYLAKKNFFSADITMLNKAVEMKKIDLVKHLITHEKITIEASTHELAEKNYEKSISTFLANQNNGRSTLKH